MFPFIDDNAGDIVNETRQEVYNSAKSCCSLHYLLCDVFHDEQLIATDDVYNYVCIYIYLSDKQNHLNTSNYIIIQYI